MHTVFPYYGGKNTHLKWLLPLLPSSPNEIEYVEPFCGSCAVAINRKHRARRIILNDINGEVINFFMVLRDNPAMLIEQLRLTPYSEYEFRKAFEADFDPAEMPSIEWARRFGVKIFQSFSSIIDNGASWKPTAARFGERRMATYNDVAELIRHFHFHNDDALSVVKRHNKVGVLIYADPPYMLETRVCKRGYDSELNNEREFHRRLLELANESQARFAISGYHSELYDDALSNWRCYETEVCAHAAPNKSKGVTKRTEVLWTNYNPAELGGQELLF